MYDALLQILRTVFGWPFNLTPEPGVCDEQFAEGATPESLAATLNQFCVDTGANITVPWGFTGTGYEWVRYDYFKGGEYWAYYTGIALGLQVELPVDKKEEAKSVSEWYSNLQIGRTRLGYVLLDDNEYGNAELQRRYEKASFVPPEWSSRGKTDHWRLAVMEGYIPYPLDAFSAAYAATTPTLDSIRHLDSQQWLDNLRCDDKGKPRKWNEDGTPNPAFDGF